MEKHLYQGTTELILQTGLEVTPEQFDAQFETPVLPVARSIRIDLTAVDSLPIPEGEPFLMGKTKVWTTPKGEYRLHHIRFSATPWILSHRENENTLHLMVLADKWESHGWSFNLWSVIHLEHILLTSHALVLHSASIMHDGKAIIFTAPSGTGKTTQTNLWHQYRTGVTDLNGDRTLLQQTENGWYACGFPLCGSSNRCVQAAAPIGAIVIIRQAPRDKVTELTAMEKVAWLYSESTVMSMDRTNILAAMDLLEDLAQKITILCLDCTVSQNAVDTLDEYLKGK